MSGVKGNPCGEANEISRQFSPHTDKIVVRRFGAVARVLWPVKTAAAVAAIANTNQRTAERWLAGEFEPPGVVLAAVLVEITRRT